MTVYLRHAFRLAFLLFVFVAFSLWPHATHAAIVPEIHSVSHGGATIKDGDVITDADMLFSSDVWSMQFSWPDEGYRILGLWGAYKGTFGEVESGWGGSGFKRWSGVENGAMENRLGSIVQGGYGTYTILLASPKRGFAVRTLNPWFASGGAEGVAPEHYATLTFTYAPERILEECCSSVLFLPGVKGSDLYDRASGEQIWPPQLGQGNYDSTKLRMNAEGSSIHTLYTRGIIAELALRDYYASFFDSLNTLEEEGDIADWHAQPYDWRFPLNTIARGVIPLEDGGTTLVSELEMLAEHSQTGKVSIVAHSMGGLVGKLLIDELERQGKEDLVDRLVMVGTPQLGTPLAVPVLLHGFGQEIFGGLVLRESYARAASLYMPSAYALIPSLGYDSIAGIPVAKIQEGETGLSSWSTAYGERYDPAGTLDQFLADTKNVRSAPTFTDVQSPAELSSRLLEKTRETQERLDAWSAPVGIEVVSIAGWGMPTLKGIEYYTKDGSVRLKPIISKEGDGTVVVESAEPNSGEVLYFNLSQYQKEEDIEVVHENILANGVLQDTFHSLMTGKTFEPGSFLYTSVPDGPTGSATLIGTHSPVAIGATNSAGQFTGRILGDNPQVMQIVENIPGSKYFHFGEDKYVWVPEGEEYTFSLEGTGEGSFTLTLDEYEGDEKVAEHSYGPVSVTAESIGEARLDTEGELTTFLIDQDGDGTFELDLLAEENESDEEPQYQNSTEYLEALREIIPTLEIGRHWHLRFLHRLIFIEHFLNKDRPYQASILVRSIFRFLDEWDIDREATREFRSILTDFYAYLRSQIE